MMSREREALDRWNREIVPMLAEVRKAWDATRVRTKATKPVGRTVAVYRGQDEKELVAFIWTTHIREGLRELIALAKEAR